MKCMINWMHINYSFCELHVSGNFPKIT